MIRSLPFAAFFAVAASLAFAHSQAHGPIDTVARGPYVCETPGDAAGQAGIPQPERNFKIESDSRYSSPQGVGVYLRRGDRLEMTTGPRKGEAYQVVHTDLLRLLKPDGTSSRLRCVQQH
ncbi:MAG TPA: elongation factor P [Croceibacterium sp.]|nr:elongation factor P [Croceibacterium sp.]